MTGTRTKQANVFSIEHFRPPMRTTSISTVTQERLREGAALMEEQQRILAAVQAFKLDLDRDLASGAPIESGDLTFDRDLKIVRPRARCATVKLQGAIR